MKEKVRTVWGTIQTTLIRGLVWLLVLPAGWWVMTTSYRLQKHWSETRFVACYLLLYVLLALGLLILPKSRVAIPGLISWTIAVFAGVGIGRILWAMVQYEYETGAEIPLRSTVLLLGLGASSLWVIGRFHRPKKKQGNLKWVRVQRALKPSQGEAVSGMHEEMHLW